MPNNIDLYTSLRKALDNGDITGINTIFTNNPALDWNAITPNGLSALWWALTPPSGQSVNFEVISCLLTLRRNELPVFDPSQLYMGLSPYYYVSLYPTNLEQKEALKKLIKSFQFLFQTLQDLHRSTNPLQSIGSDTHSASNPFIIHASDESLMRLHQRYGAQRDVENEFTQIEDFIHSSTFKTLFPLIQGQQDQIRAAILRVKNDVEKRVAIDAGKGPRTLKEALTLTWRAASEGEQPIEKQKAILIALLESQITYGHNNPSCWGGTWGRIGTALCGMDVDVYYQKEALLPDDLAQGQYDVFISEQLDKLYQHDHAAYWAVLRRVLLLNPKEEDKATYVTWFASIHPEIQQSFTSIISPKLLSTLLSQAQKEGSIPVDRHVLSRQFAALQGLFNTIKKQALFDDQLKYLKNENINDALEALKDCYYEHLLIPDDFKKENEETLKQLKIRVLEAYLDNRSIIYNQLTITDCWEIIKIAHLIEKEIPQTLSWYQNLPVEKQLLLAKQTPVSISSLLDFAMEHRVLAGLCLKGANLEKKDLRGFDLSGMDLSDANLTAADLRLVSVEGVKWDQCNLTDAQFNQWLIPEALLGSIHCTPELLKATTQIGGFTVLDLAIRENNLNHIQAILNSPHFTVELLKTKTNKGMTILEKAVNLKYLHPEITQAILDSRNCESSLLEIQDSHGMTILTQALRMGCGLRMIQAETIIQPILNSKHCTSRLLEIPDNNGENALHWALQADDVNIFEAVLNSPHCTLELLSGPNKKGHNVLFKAIDLSSSSSRIQAIFDSKYCPPEYLEIKDKDGDTALHYAIKTNNPAIVKVILDSKHCTPKFLRALGKNFFLKTLLPCLLNQKHLYSGEILDLFDEIKNPKGKYAFIHEQKNPKIDKMKLFFKNNRNKDESYFWHTDTYQESVKLLKEAYATAKIIFILMRKIKLVNSLIMFVVMPRYIFVPRHYETNLII